MPVPSSILTTLTADDLGGLEAFCREKVRSVDDCHEWLQAHGYTQISRSAVGRWKKSFEMNDKFRAAGEAARELMAAAAAEKGTVAISDAATLKLSEMLFDQMLRLQSEGDAEGGGGVNTKELFGLSMALKNVVTGKRHVEKLKQEMAEAVAEAEKVAKAGGGGEAVVNVIKQAMGLG